MQSTAVMSIIFQDIGHDFQRCPTHQVVCGLQTLVEEGDLYSPEFTMNYQSSEYRKPKNQFDRGEYWTNDEGVSEKSCYVLQILSTLRETS